MPTMLDSNVLLDIITADAKWLDWSTEQFRKAAREGPIPVNPVIYSELAPAFESQAALDRWLKPTIFQRLPLPYEAAYRASVAFLAYRQRGWTKTFSAARLLHRRTCGCRRLNPRHQRSSTLSHLLPQR